MVLSTENTKTVSIVFCLQRLHHPETETIKQTFIAQIRALRRKVQRTHLRCLLEESASELSIIKNETLKGQRRSVLSRGKKPRGQRFRHNEEH